MAAMVILRQAADRRGVFVALRYPAAQRIQDSEVAPVVDEIAAAAGVKEGRAGARRRGRQGATCARRGSGRELLILFFRRPRRQ